MTAKKNRIRNVKTYPGIPLGEPQSGTDHLYYADFLLIQSIHKGLQAKTCEQKDRHGHTASLVNIFNLPL